MNSSPGDWTASALFSPSKARAQQAQAKDWAFVEVWLAKKYGKRIPTFEKNEETLQALLTLATLNESADEQRSLIERVEKATFQATAKRVEANEAHYSAVLRNLGEGGNETLSALAECATLLGNSDVHRAAETICALTAERFELATQVEKVRVQQFTLEREHVRLRAIMEDLSNPNFIAPSDIVEQTSEWTRSTKHTKAKIMEYEERLGVLRSAPSPSPSLEDVLRSQEELSAQRMRLSEVTTEFSTFDSLPSDARMARLKLENARGQLRTLTTKRDELFEGLVDG